ncbi:Ethanolamine ammonia-lyase light chain [Acetitomaculum ruminis DSM 5522]|uniref:Ethanolamine ammonia-lyase small subunit n=1 Tax=Acetitomaculum ruminis DSM 5522 TaxID=1120918 RepID=A0A1I0ZY45_9FIRM|nr:ethanolamine ammonia-lyase subunit EutC [Acetitomaculum ruminis]SFB28993.1 Ethanolamine ammonia-lyase light chain [Acetitomaculum ruminis DSM 5522]
MVSENDLKNIIAQVLNEMNLSGGSDQRPSEEIKTNSESAPPNEETTKGKFVPDPSKNVVEDGCWDDVAAVSLQKQYLVENPVNGEAFYDLKQFAPCRLGIGKAGARYKTDPQLQFRAAHSAAQDAVFSDVDQDFVDNMGLFTVQTMCDSKDTYLTRPDLGRKLSEEAVATIKEKCKMNPTVQIYVSDGLSSAAIAANVGDVLPALEQGLKSYGIDYGTPFFVKYGRVGVEDQISEITKCDVVCVLIGERPGLITATSMSAYIAYKATVGMPEARRTVLSNIHKEGTNPAEAGAHIADIIKKILDNKASGTDLKL